MRPRADPSARPPSADVTSDADLGADASGGGSARKPRDAEGRGRRRSTPGGRGGHLDPVQRARRRSQAPAPSTRLASDSSKELQKARDGDHRRRDGVGEDDASRSSRTRRASPAVSWWRARSLAAWRRCPSRAAWPRRRAPSSATSSGYAIRFEDVSSPRRASSFFSDGMLLREA